MEETSQSQRPPLQQASTESQNGVTKPKFVDGEGDELCPVGSPLDANSLPSPVSTPRPPASRRHRTLTFRRPPPTTNKHTRPTPSMSSTLPTVPTTNRNRPRNRSNRSHAAYPLVNFTNPHFSTQAHLDRDGRVHIKFDHLTGTRSTPLSSLLDSTLKQQFSINLLNNLKNTATPVLDCVPPRLTIVIMVIGSRGDIQPFVALAKVLVGDWGHRVRLATHPEFKDFIEDEFKAMEEDIEKEEQEEKEGKRKERAKPRIKGGKGEFFSVGGDPQELMAFMVKNPGLLPSLETIKAGEVARRRQQMGIMFEGFWRSCVEPSNYVLEEEKGTDQHANIDRIAQHGQSANQEDEAGKKKKNKKRRAVIQRLAGSTPFIADAIIANPPSFAHIHCAEKLGIPLHLMFTFPYTPTATIPHPLANISQNDVEAAYTNIISYSMVEMMTWQGLGDLVNRFRKETLGLEPLSTLWAPGLLARLKVPTTYMWSPSLIPKPADWGPHIDISGFVFLGKADSFTPPDDLKEFLDAEPDNPPVYIGFGSIVVDDPDSLTQLIFDSAKEAGVRALVSKGWGGLGGEETKPDNVFMLDNTPHDWLFPKCRAVIHHGGAGTTAIGLKCGKPTFIVSFFGDQPFWGQMVKNAGAGDWTPFKDLDKDSFVEGIKTVIAPETAEKAAGMAEKIAQEGDGAHNAVMSFYRALETVGVTKNVGERGRKRKKRKERRPDVGPEVVVHGPEDVVSGRVGVVNTTAAVAAREDNDGDAFRMEEEKEEGAKASRSLLSGISFAKRFRKKSGPALSAGATPAASDMEDAEDSGIGESDANKDSIQDYGIRCSILPEAVAVWRVRRTRIKLSAVAAWILVSEGKFTWKDLRLVRHTEWNDFDGPGEPLSGGAGAIVTALGGVAKGLFGVPYTWYKGAKRVGEDIETKGEGQGMGKIVENSRLIRERKGRKSIDGGSSSKRTSIEQAQTNKLKEDGKCDERASDNDDEEDEEEGPISRDILHGTTHSISSIVRTGCRLPMDISLALAQGFHNAPRLYGDTVRRPNRITGLHSGLRAAGKEVTLGLYDTITGLVLKPYRGAKAHGPIGFVSGVGKATGGIVFGLGAGVAGTIGYTLKGVHKELHKGPERAVMHAIRDQRVWQGEREDAELRAEGDGVWEGVRDRVIKGWEEEERREFEKIQGEAELKREISGVREIGWGAAKLRQLKKREEKRRRKNARREGKGGKLGGEDGKRLTEEEKRRKEAVGLGRGEEGEGDFDVVA